MSRLSVQVQYDKKIEELHKLIAEEAKKLQNVIDERDFLLLEIKNLSSRKTALGRVIADLETQTKEKQEVLNQLVLRETSFINSAKVELNKEKSSLEEFKKLREKLQEELQGLNKVTSELNRFIQKEGDIKQRYLQEKEKLQQTETKTKEITIKTSEELEKLDRKNKELDIYKQYLTDLYGRIASYIKVAEESVIFVNEFMEKNQVPMKFELPPGEIISIDFNNFDIKPVDT